MTAVAETRVEKPAPPDWLLSNIAESSKTAQQVFFVLASLLAYSALTIVGTADRQIILNSTVQLPVLNVAVSMTGFYLVAPALSLVLFVYMQFYLQRVNGLLVQMASEYSPVEERRLYPSLMNIARDPEPGIAGVLQRATASFSLWWSIPLTFLLFSFWFVKAHDHRLGYVVGLWPMLGLAVVLFFRWQYDLNDRSRIWHLTIIVPAAVILIFDLLLLLFIVPNANDGTLYHNYELSPDFTLNQSLLQTWTTVNVSYQVLVVEQKKEYNTFWVDLEDAHLEGANLTNSILKLANLRKAHFRAARLLDSTLRGAQLQGADFTGATVKGADFAYADITGARSLGLQKICSAKTLYKTIMEPKLAEGVRKSCPALLTEQSQDF